MRKIIALSLAALMLPASAYANVASYRTDCAADGSVTITGSFDTEHAPAILGLRVLKAGKELAELTGKPEEDLAITDYIRQIELSPDSTEFEISLLLPEGSTGSRKARLLGTGFTAAADIELQYVTLSDYRAAVSAVNASIPSGVNAFISACKEGDNMFCLGFDEDIADADEALTVVYNTVAGSGLDENDRLKTVGIWRAASVAALFNQGADVDISAYRYCFDYLPEKVTKWLDTVLNRDSRDAENRLKSLITDQHFKGLNDLEKRLKEALVLTITEYHGGIGNIGGVISDFSDITGITAKNDTVVYQRIGGTRYPELASLLRAYSEAKTSGANTGGGGGGGGGGSAAGGASIVLTTPVTQNDITEVSKNETIPLLFVDLDMAAWAYEAVSTLFDRGIISGKTDTVFAPLDPVTREEFVKILVCASGYENSEYITGRFKDVPVGAWYEKYVCIAADEGLVNGIEDDRFGVGERISRQDMAVMIYRLLGIKNTAPKPAELSFTDSGQISDYASEAVGALAGSGMVNGVGDGLFVPLGTATRAEAAQMVFNVLASIS